jgi:hypothetical protein
MAHYITSEFARSVRIAGLSSSCAYLQSSAPHGGVCYNQTARCKVAVALSTATYHLAEGWDGTWRSIFVHGVFRRCESSVLPSYEALVT